MTHGAALYKQASTPSEGKSATSQRDMAKITHFTVAKSCKENALAALPLLKLDNFRSYHAPNPQRYTGPNVFVTP